MGYKNQQFDDFDQWVWNAENWLTIFDENPDGSDPSHMDKEERERSGYRAMCFDKYGRPCTMGRHFMRARDEGAFPVRWLWPHQVARNEVWVKPRHETALEEILVHIDALDPHIPEEKQALVKVINSIEDLANDALGREVE